MKHSVLYPERVDYRKIQRSLQDLKTQTIPQQLLAQIPEHVITQGLKLRTLYNERGECSHDLEEATTEAFRKSTQEEINRLTSEINVIERLIGSEQIFLALAVKNDSSIKEMPSSAQQSVSALI